MVRIIYLYVLFPKMICSNFSISLLWLFVTFFVRFYVKTISINVSLQKQILLSYNLWNVLTMFDALRNIRRHVIKKKNMKFLIAYSKGAVYFIPQKQRSCFRFRFSSGALQMCLHLVEVKISYFY